MLTVTITNKLETQQLAHKSGPLEVGRGPARGGTARAVVKDAFVSRDHLRLDERPGRKVKVSNLSARAPVTVDGYAVLNPGADCDYLLPVRVAIGETTVDVDCGDAEPASANAMRTIAAPARAEAGHQTVAAAPPPPPLIERSESARPEEIVGMLETVVTVQKAGDRDAFYRQAAEALVEKIGLDTGLVLVKDGDAWRVAAQSVRDAAAQGLPFSHAVLNQALATRQTVYLAAAGNVGESLAGVQGVVASPFFDARGAAAGVVYGTRLQRANGREIGPLEAQVVQLIAAAVGAGVQRLEQDEETNRLRVEKEAAQQADRTKSGFVAMISHELRTPLTTIIGYSEMLIEQAADDQLPGQYGSDLGQILTAAKHLLALINDILDFSKIEAGKLEIAKEPYSPAGLLRDLMVAVEPMARRNNNRLEVDIPADLGAGRGDPTRIRQCVLNLVDNACKFTKDGAVKVSARREGDSLRVAVSDTGIGMSPDQVGRLFQAFTQVDSSAGRKYGGTGLGLAISQKLSNAMGGQITAASEPGKGSTFTMTISAVL